ncbi:MAG: endonuclease MutS2 [Thermodesulfobacteriota bacterium]
MDETTLENLEYPLILAELSAGTATPYGAELALSLRPAADPGTLPLVFTKLTEVIEYSNLSGSFSLSGLADIRPYLNKAATEGAYLAGVELLEVLKTLQTFKRLSKLTSASFLKSYPAISGVIGSVADLGNLLANLDRVLDDKGEVKDNASKELARVRRSIRKSKTRARGYVDKLRKKEGVAARLQEDFLTIRDDRFVVSVKAGEQTAFPGVIHGRSGSGGTFFVEPMELVELNNKLSILKREERAEEILVLREVTALTVERTGEIVSSIRVLAELDLIQAKSALAKKLSAVVPAVNSGGSVRLKGARHPVLILKELSGDGRAVPIDITIEEDLRVLVISGANTGGKTAALKTLGLLTLMAGAGLPIPVSEGTEVRVFARVLADIGDRQSIADSLSTFSAHIATLSGFLGSAAVSSLILIDEIGVGTDPAEGGVLALALLKRLAASGATTVVTTHINLLKAHAATGVNDEFANASVIFDADTMSPSYNLNYGTPGASHGLKIAAGLGMDGELIKDAREMLGTGEGAFIDSISALDREREEVGELKARLGKLAKERDAAVGKLRADREKILKRVEKRADSLLSDAEVEIKGIVADLREAGGGGSSTITGGARAAGKKAIDKAEKSVAATMPKEKEKAVPYVPIEGDTAEIAGTTTRGLVTKLYEDDKEAELTVGKVKVRVKWEKLRKTSADKNKKKVSVSKNVEVLMEDLPAPEESINIIGKRVAEALPMLTLFIDGAHANGITRVEIIHGKGTGALGNAVKEFLSESPFVKKVRKGAIQEGAGGSGGGGAGVTVAELR